MNMIRDVHVNLRPLGLLEKIPFFQKLQNFQFFSNQFSNGSAAPWQHLTVVNSNDSELKPYVENNEVKDLVYNRMSGQQASQN